MDTSSQEKLLRKNKIGIYLDDNRTPLETPEDYEWIVVRSYEEFTDLITKFYRANKRLPELFSFDHDLTQEYIEWYFAHPGERIIDYGEFKTKSGFHCAVWLMTVCEANKVSVENTLFAVHSHNEAGAKNIQEYINKYKGDKYGFAKANCFLKNWRFKYVGDEEVPQERPSGHSLLNQDS